VKHEKNIVSDPDCTVDVECVPNAYALCACAAGHGHLAPDHSSSDQNGRAAKSNRRADGYVDSHTDWHTDSGRNRYTCDVYADRDTVADRFTVACTD